MPIEIQPSATDASDLIAYDHPGAILQALLKHPQHLIEQMHRRPGVRLPAALSALTLTGFAAYGVLVGSFSGGVQMWGAPLKIVGGSILSALICLPSLYVFSCLGGGAVSLVPLCAALLASLSLNALLLLSFAPVAWVFSQSTDSLALMGFLHLLFWAIGLLFGLRLISVSADYSGLREKSYLRLWCIVFALVCLQMTTALRPIIGTAPTFLPTEKQFFLSHWVESMR